MLKTGPISKSERDSNIQRPRSVLYATDRLHLLFCRGVYAQQTTTEALTRSQNEMRAVREASRIQQQQQEEKVAAAATVATAAAELQAQQQQQQQQEQQQLADEKHGLTQRYLGEQQGQVTQLKPDLEAGVETIVTSRTPRAELGPLEFGCCCLKVAPDMEGSRDPCL